MLVGLKVILLVSIMNSELGFEKLWDNDKRLLVCSGELTSIYIPCAPCRLNIQLDLPFNDVVLVIAVHER